MRNPIRATLVALALFFGSAVYTHADEPFNTSTVPAKDGAFVEKWRIILRGLQSEKELMLRCEQTGNCSHAQIRLRELVDIVRHTPSTHGLQVFNQAVNALIKYKDDDVRFGAPDIWVLPNQTLADLEGDCEDYAIVKYAALLAYGAWPEDVKIVVVSDLGVKTPNAAHAFTVFRDKGVWRILDSRMQALRTTAALGDRYVPRFVFDAQGARKYVHDASLALTKL